MSSSGGSGGILRKGRETGSGSGSGKKPRGGAGVSFGDTTTSRPPTNARSEEYDSDDLYDASAVSGSLPAAVVQTTNNNVNDGERNDEVARQQAEVEAAKRRRREAKEHSGGELAERADEIDRIGQDEDGGGDLSVGAARGGRDRSQFRGEEDIVDNNLSLINTKTESNTATGAYDAGPNAECPVEPFNLRAEREGGEGYFDGDTYVFRRSAQGDNEEPDAWVEGLDVGGGAGGAATTSSSADASIARISNKNKARDEKSKGSALDLEGLSHEELCGRTAALLANDNETVARALKRYGDVIARDRKRRQKAAKKKKAGGEKSGQEEDAGGTDMNHDESDAGVSAAHKSLSELTELADALLMDGDGEIYGRKRSELVKSASSATTDDDHVSGHKRKRDYFSEEAPTATQVKAPKTTAAEGNGPSAIQKEPIQWEYKGNQDNQIHGPYTTEQMIGWIQAGYFVGDAAVDVRKVVQPTYAHITAVASSAAASAAADTADDLMADLMDSDDEDNSKKDEGSPANIEPWEKSDKVDFKSYL